MYEWDEAKRRLTLKERGVDFCDIERFEWATAISYEDKRTNYGERRVSSLGKIAAVFMSALGRNAVKMFALLAFARRMHER